MSAKSTLRSTGLRYPCHIPFGTRIIHPMGGIVAEVIRHRRGKVTTWDDLDNIESVIKEADYVGCLPYYKKSLLKNDVTHMLYFEAKVQNGSVLLKVAKSEYTSKNGRKEIRYFIYSLSRKKEHRRRHLDLKFGSQPAFPSVFYAAKINKTPLSDK